MVSNVKSQDTFHIKQCLPQYIIPPDPNVNKNEYFIPDAGEDIKETQWGWHSNILSQFLCPMRLVAEFDQDLTRIKSMSSLNYHYMQWFMTSRAFWAHVLAGNININSFEWPVFCYDKSKYDPENPKQGLFQGYFLLHIYWHIFSGPSSALKKKDKGRNSHGQKNCLLVPTPETIGYAAIIVYILG